MIFFFSQGYLVFNVGIPAKKSLAGSIYWISTLWYDVPAQWQQMWHVKNLQAGVFAVTFHSLSCASLPAFPNRWSFGHVCAFYDKRLQVMKSILFLGRGTSPCLGGGSGPLLGWCHKLTWLDCREQILLTEESRHVLSVIWIWKSALNSEIVALRWVVRG